MNRLFSSPVSKAFWMLAKTLGSTVTAVVGAEIAKRALKNFGSPGDAGKWEQKAQAQEAEVKELRQEVADLQQRVEELKNQAFTVPWPPIPPNDNLSSAAPITEGKPVHYPKGES